MTLLQSWKDSLTLFKPKNFKLFALVTLKSILDTYKILFRYWWWLLLLIVIGSGLSSLGAFLMGEGWRLFGQADTANTLNRYLLYFLKAISPLAWFGLLFYPLLHLFFSQLMIFATCLSTRPSVQKKDWSYVRSYILYFAYFAVGYFLHIRFVSKLLPILSQAVTPTIFQLFFTPFLLFSAFSPSYIFFLMFFLDSDKKIKQLFLSLYHSWKMVVFNYPLCLIIAYVLTFLNRQVFIMGGKIYSLMFKWQVGSAAKGMIFLSKTWLFTIIGILILPIPICIFVNIYVKKLHDQFDVYFKQPK